MREVWDHVGRDSACARGDKMVWPYRSHEIPQSVLCIFVVPDTVYAYAEATASDEKRTPARSTPVIGSQNPTPERQATMLIVAGHITVDPDLRETYLAGCVRVVEQARRTAGCLDFAIDPDLLDSGRVNIFERWDSREVVEAFRSGARARIKAPRYRRHRSPSTTSVMCGRCPNRRHSRGVDLSRLRTVAGGDRRDSGGRRCADGRGTGS